LRVLDTLEDIVVAAGIAIMGVALALQIFMRYVLNMPLVWSEEFARYLFVWVTFVGAGYGVRHGIHIAMEFFYNKMPASARRIVSIVTNVLSIGAFASLLPTGIYFTREQWPIASSAMQIPMSLVIAAVPVGCLLVCFRLAVDTVRLIRRPRAGGDAA
jgi:TRAP-type C4-dicarboxylate transport system permease small subunit